MGRIDLAFLAADGRGTALEATWLMLAAISAAAVIAYVIASYGFVRSRGEAQRD